MKITIITPCSRPYNLEQMKESMQFEYISEWIIVYDAISGKKSFPENELISEYFHKSEGVSGNPQRNYALDYIKNKDTFLYYLDDDNIIHHRLYDLLDTINQYNSISKINVMYTFNQDRCPGILNGNCVRVNCIDSAMALIPFKETRYVRWKVDLYNADGYYLEECSKQIPVIYVNEILCYYNKINIKNEQF